VLYAGEGVLPNRPRAEALMLAACEKGSGNACLELARFYDDTAGALPQETRGIEALKRLCKATLSSDSAQACYGWGVLLKHGHGVPQDTAFALKVLQRACNTGSIPDRGCDAVPQE
jgi:TPR repeat protein